MCLGEYFSIFLCSLEILTLENSLTLQLYKYQQEYELALFGYARACLLDPTWKEAQTLEKNLVSHLGRIQELVESRVGVLCLYVPMKSLK